MKSKLLLLRRVLKSLIISIALLFFYLASNAQTQTFDSAFNYKGSSEWGWSVLVVDSESYLVTGSGGDSLFNNDGLIYNLKLNGELNAFNQISNDGIDYYVGLSGSAKKTLDENYIVAGGIESFDPLDQDALLVKYDEFGDTLFVKYYGNVFDNFYNSAILSDSGYALIGFTYNEIGGDVNMLLVRTDKNGNQIFSKSYGGIEVDIGFTVNELSSNRYILSGIKKYLPNYAPWIIVTDSSGNILKEKEWASGLFFCGGGKLTPMLDSQYLYTGCIDTVAAPGDYLYTPVVAKLDTAFNILWLSLIHI